MSKAAIVFPGQGSQSVGMLAELAADWALVSETFAEASDALGYDLWSLVQNGTTEQLGQTVVTQPAMLAAGVATFRVWQRAGGPTPRLFAGHSLGEYTALVAAGALDFSDACQVVNTRAQLMQAAVASGEGGMAAILGLSDDAVIELCESLPTDRIVEPVNFNAPGQVVIAGHADAITEAIAAARDAGAKRAVELPVSVPAHSSLLREAADELATTLAATTFRSPEIPVIHNADARPREEQDAIREALRRQLYNPVRWVETVEYMKSQGIEQLVELGPGKVLTGLTKRIDRSLAGMAVEDRASLDQAVAACSVEEN